jgi:hypothetical protein
MKPNLSLRFFVVIIVAGALGAGSLSYAQETAETRTAKLSFTDAPSADGQTQSTGKTATPSPVASADDD